MFYRLCSPVWPPAQVPGTWRIWPLCERCNISRCMYLYKCAVDHWSFSILSLTVFLSGVFLSTVRYLPTIYLRMGADISYMFPISLLSQQSRTKTNVVLIFKCIEIFMINFKYPTVNLGTDVLTWCQRDVSAEPCSSCSRWTLLCRSGSASWPAQTGCTPEHIS